jgi:hypothetical protein
MNTTRRSEEAFGVREAYGDKIRKGRRPSHQRQIMFQSDGCRLRVNGYACDNSLLNPARRNFG